MEEKAVQPRKSQQMVYSFTQADVDAVLYGYLRAHSESDMPLHSISGIKFIPYQYPQGIPLAITGKNKKKWHLNLSSKLLPYEPGTHGLLTPISPVPPLSPWLPSNGLLQTSAKPQAFFPPSPNKKVELPSFVAVRHLQIGTLFHVGVFSTNVIPQATRLGPFSGKLLGLKDIDRTRDNSCIWEICSNDGVMAYVDGTVDPKNWMKAINCARYKKEQNLVLVQVEDEIFYETMRDISPGEELLIWYGSDYERYMDIPIGYKGTISKRQQSVSEETEGTPEEAGSFPCEHCGKVFSYRYYRDKHLKYTRCVDQGDRKFPCHLCQRSFEKRDRLRIHILHVHQKHRPHLCNVCGKRFSQSSSLSKHQRVHSGERPYKCPHCVKAFTASSILRTHLRQHSGERPFKCKHCGKAFASHAAHDSHVRRTHTKVKPCVCSICDKAFAQSYELKFHMNIHTGAKPYSCEKCGRGFSSPSSRDRHRHHFDCTNKSVGGSRKGSGSKSLSPADINNNEIQDEVFVE